MQNDNVKIFLLTNWANKTEKSNYFHVHKLNFQAYIFFYIFLKQHVLSWLT